jgi:hypothetical protein
VLAITVILGIAFLATFGLHWLGGVVLVWLKKKPMSNTVPSNWLVGVAVVGAPLALWFVGRSLSDLGIVEWPERWLTRIEKSLPTRKLKSVPLQDLTKRMKHDPGRVLKYLEES